MTTYRDTSWPLLAWPDHDGGSGFWTDENNVFNHIGTSAVFCHGNCPGISISPIYYNDSGAPNMQGATNRYDILILYVKPASAEEEIVEISSN